MKYDKLIKIHMKKSWWTVSQLETIDTVLNSFYDQANPLFSISSSVSWQNNLFHLSALK